HFGAEFGPDGTITYTSGRDGTLRAWDAASGDLLFEAAAVGGGRPSATADGRVLVGDFTDKIATVIDPVRGRDTSAIAQTCQGGAVPAGQLQIRGGIAFFGVECDDGTSPTYRVDTATMLADPVIGSSIGQGIGVSPDGSRLALQTRE